MQDVGVTFAGWTVMVADDGTLYLDDGAETTSYPLPNGDHPMNWHGRKGTRSNNPHCPYCYAGRHPDEIRAIRMKYEKPDERREGS